MIFSSRYFCNKNDKRIHLSPHPCPRVIRNDPSYSICLSMSLFTLLPTMLFRLFLLFVVEYAKEKFWRICKSSWLLLILFGYSRNFITRQIFIIKAENLFKDQGWVTNTKHIYFNKTSLIKLIVVSSKINY